MSSRNKTFFSLGIIPALMGLGHLAPAIGAIHTATGSYQFPIGLLGLIGIISAVVDSIDTYKDIPKKSRPRSWIWGGWVGSLWLIIIVCTMRTSIRTSILVYRVLPLGLLWGSRCIPQYSATKGFYLAKPKTLLVGVKSLVVALCMGSVCAQASMAYFCAQSEAQCTDDSLRTRSFYLACLYEFFRETACDIRDIAEDKREGIATLPVKLGQSKTLLLMATVGLVVDATLSRALVFTSIGVVVFYQQFAYSLARVGATMAADMIILRYPRDNIWAWGAMSMFGLVPVLFAQRALLDEHQSMAQTVCAFADRFSGTGGVCKKVDVSPLELL